MASPNGGSKKRRPEESTDTRKRRRLSRFSSSVTSVEETATSLGGASVFRQTWSQLRKVGWTSNPPSSRSLDQRYIVYSRPGGDPSDTEGRGFFGGELVLLQSVTGQLGSGDTVLAGKTAAQVRSLCL